MYDSIALHIVHVWYIFALHMPSSWPKKALVLAIGRMVKIIILLLSSMKQRVLLKSVSEGLKIKSQDEKWR